MLARWLFVVAIGLLLAGSGCGPSRPPVVKNEEKGKENSKGNEVKETKSEGNTETKPEAKKEKKPAPKPRIQIEKRPERKPEEKYRFGNLIDPYTPPTLAELDKIYEGNWREMPVLDALELLRKRQEGEPKLATVEEALALHNDSPEANDKILSALSRLPASEKNADLNATIYRHTGGDVKSVNGVLGSSVADFDVEGLIGVGLFSFDWKFNRFAAKDSVVSWHQSDDRMVDKVVMRKDLFWSDGKPVTAHDVVFSWKLIMTEKVPVPAVRSGTEKLRWVEAYDDYTVAFFHQEQLATNEWNVSFPVVPKHVFESTVEADPFLTNSEPHVAFENNPVVGGPYKVSKRTRGREIELERREEYYMVNGKQVRDKPYFKTVTIRVVPDPSVALLQLEAGDLHEKILNPEEWKTKTDDDAFYERNTKAYGVEWVNFQFTWNLKKPFFEDVRVRRALSLAFDHKFMINTLRFNLDQPARGMFHPDSPYHPVDKKWLKTDYNKLNRKEAERLLDEAGWKDTDNDGIRDKEINGEKVKFDFTVIVRSSPDRIEICNLLKRNLAQVGINCFISPLEFTVLQQKMLDHNFDAAFGGWGTGAYPDTSENLFKTGEERNYGNYSNKEVDALFSTALKSLDNEERLEIFRKIHQMVYEDQPFMWLYYQNAYYAFNKKLRGYNFSPRGPYHYGPGFGSIWVPATP